jgi:hypothetical protein
MAPRLEASFIYTTLTTAFNGRLSLRMRALPKAIIYFAVKVSIDRVMLSKCLSAYGRRYN